METVLIAAAVLACPIGMGLMMWFMAKGMGASRKRGEDPGSASLAELRAEQERVAAEIEDLERGESGLVDAPKSPSHA